MNEDSALATSLKTFLNQNKGDIIVKETGIWF